MREIMKNLLVVAKPLWIVISSIVTIVVIGREIAWEMRPAVKPDMPLILGRLEAAIQEVSPETHDFKITVTGDSDLLRVSDVSDGASPLLSMDIIGNFTITGTVQEVTGGEHDFQSFMLLCEIAGRMKSGSESLDFNAWIADATNTTDESVHLPMFVGGRYKAIHQITNGVMQITVLN